jgi:hypothetical protein
MERWWVRDALGIKFEEAATGITLSLMIGGNCVSRLIGVRDEEVADATYALSKRGIGLVRASSAGFERALDECCPEAPKEQEQELVAQEEIH